MIFFLVGVEYSFPQSVSFATFTNPVIPGDHPDCTLTKIGNNYYTAGSSFNPTPVIYRSTDLVHWEAAAQPVRAEWLSYGDAPAGGCWGGQVVFRNNKYWYFFSRSNTMYFTTADDIKGEWTLPTQIITPAPVPGLGYDNSIFIDDNNKWYLLVKNGQVNNWIVELGDDGQANGAILDLRWLNPAPSYPFSWAEGPVMWKYKGKYYYSFGRNVGGGQKVFVSDSLTDKQSAWTNLGDFFNESDPLKYQAVFTNPNHSSAAVVIDDSTSWVVHPLWRSGNNNEWYGQGRQGLLNQVRYDASGKPTADYPVNEPRNAPKLPSSGIPWMVPHSDQFVSSKLNPEWSFLGYTPTFSYSLTDQPGWFMLSPKNRKANTIIKNDGEHNYSIITKVDFDPVNPADQAGIQIFNGNQNLYVKLYSSIDSTGKRIVRFNFKNDTYSVNNPSGTKSIVWLKLIRENHELTGFCSNNGFDWIKIGSGFNVRELDGFQSNYNSWTGNRQGLYAYGNTAYFDFYIYRDGYTPILAECPANQFGTNVLINRDPPNAMNNISNNDWALFAGVEFGNPDYPKTCDSIKVIASSPNAGGTVEIYIDSIDVKTKIADCRITTTGSWTEYKTFAAKVMKQVSGNHDVYLKFVGSDNEDLFQLQSFHFVTNAIPTSIENNNSLPNRIYLNQNYPNPFNPTTEIKYSIPDAGNISLVVFDVLGRQVKKLFEGYRTAGNYNVVFNADDLSSGIYFYQLKADSFIETKKMMLIK